MFGDEKNLFIMTSLKKEENDVKKFCWKAIRKLLKI